MPYNWRIAGVDSLNLAGGGGIIRQVIRWASRIASGLLAMGMDLRPRTIRLHLLQLDELGFTRLISRRSGRAITDAGHEELTRGVDTLTYRMTFRSHTGEGKIILNVCMIDQKDVAQAYRRMRSVYERRLAMGTKMIVVGPGEALGGVEVPAGAVGLGTVCSVTVNGILLHEGIPVVSRFGGLLEMRDWTPVRFVEAIEYRGSTLDPLEVFIKADMTRVDQVLRTGSGIVCASFREVPSVAVDDIRQLQPTMESFGLGGILAIGKPNQPLFGVPVSEGYSGMVVYGGLNPIAAAHESGVRISVRSLGGLQDFSTLKEFSEYAEDLAAS